MTKSSYKVITSSMADYWNRVTTTFAHVTFAELVIIKGLNPKTAGKPYKRLFKTKQVDRCNKDYPNSYIVAKLFGLDSMPSVDAEMQPSSQRATREYIKLMYPYDITHFSYGGVL